MLHVGITYDQRDDTQRWVSRLGIYTYICCWLNVEYISVLWRCFCVRWLHVWMLVPPNNTIAEQYCCGTTKIHTWAVFATRLMSCQQLGRRQNLCHFANVSNLLCMSSRWETISHKWWWWASLASRDPFHKYKLSATSGCQKRPNEGAGWLSFSAQIRNTMWSN